MWKHYDKAMEPIMKCTFYVQIALFGSCVLGARELASRNINLTVTILNLILSSIKQQAYFALSLRANAYTLYNSTYS